MYADDLFMIVPYSRSAKIALKTIEEWSQEHGMKIKRDKPDIIPFNSGKSPDRQKTSKATRCEELKNIWDAQQTLTCPSISTLSTSKERVPSSGTDYHSLGSTVASSLRLSSLCTGYMPHCSPFYPNHNNKDSSSASEGTSGASAACLKAPLTS